MITKDNDEASRDLARVCALVAQTPAVLPGHACDRAMRAK
jgi:hypothetical protein